MRALRQVGPARQTKFEFHKVATHPPRFERACVSTGSPGFAERPFRNVSTAPAPSPRTDFDLARRTHPSTSPGSSCKRLSSRATTSPRIGCRPSCSGP